jgi:DTW domain-containing protein YfiP
MKRPMCDGCGRPEKVCLCSHLQRVKLPFELVIWQDPDEAKHPLSTAPLLQKIAFGSELLVGSEFSYRDIFSDTQLENVALLYPLKDTTPLTIKSAQTTVRKVLVLDGTWRKVRRLLLLNPWLNDLGCLALTPTSASRYLRKSPREDGVSTLEAVMMLAHEWNDEDKFLNTSNTDYLSSLAVLDRMAELQKSFTPKI